MASHLPSRAACVLGLLLALTGAAYLPGLGGPLLLDDSAVFNELTLAIARGHFTPELLLSHSGPLRRPLAMASFALDAKWHGTAWAGWKATNVVLHLACGWALFALFACIARAAGYAERPARELALVAAAVWLVHPLHVSTVLYTVQRMTELSSLFCILGLWLYAQGRMAMIDGRDGRVAVIAAVLVCTALAALAKETGLLLPWFIAALELTVFARGTQPRPRWLLAGLLALTVLPFVAAVVYLLARPENRFLAGYATRDFGLGERLMTEPRVVVGYLRWIVFPRASDYGFYHDAITVTRKLAQDWPALAAIAAIGVLAVAAWCGRRRWPLPAFGMALFLLGLALESTVLPLDLAFEHRTYLPAAGILLVCAVAVMHARNARIRRGLVAAAVAVLLFTTVLRVLVWAEAGTLHHALLAADLGSERARVTLAEWYVAQGAPDRALDLLEVPGKRAFAVHRQRILCLRDGRPDADAARVIASMTNPREISRYARQVLFDLAESALDGRCAWPAPQIRAILDVLHAQPINRHARHRLEIQDAKFSLRQGDRVRALERLARAARLQADDPFVHYLQAEWLADAGDVDGADEALAAARQRPRSAAYARIDQAVVELIAHAREAAQSSGD